MAKQIPRPKWILYRHTNDFNLLCEYAILLKGFSSASITEEDKLKLTLRAKELGLFKERNKGLPLDSISHYINQLANYMFGYKDSATKRFMFSPLGNLLLTNINDEKRVPKIFLTMLWGFQYPHPHAGTDDSFQLFPFRLIYKLLLDNRLSYKLYAYEVAYYVMFYTRIDKTSYEELVQTILHFRNLSDEEITKLFNKDRHPLVNCVYEWDYYITEFFKQAGVLEKVKDKVICKLQHGNKGTYRKVTRNWVQIPTGLTMYIQKLLELFPFDDKPIALNDGHSLKIDIIKELYNFYPNVLLKEIGEVDEWKQSALELPKLIQEYSLNPQNSTANLFEKILAEGFNMFYNVKVHPIGGSGQTDIECLYIMPNKKKKFAVDAKSTSKKLTGINAGRLKEHRNKIGGEYTIVITPQYVPAAKQDIKDTQNVIILANTFAEYLYNCIESNEREIDYSDFDNIITSHFGSDISKYISDLSFSKFAVDGK